VFQNGLEDRNADAKRLNDNHSYTLCMGGARILTYRGAEERAEGYNSNKAIVDSRLHPDARNPR